MLGSSCRVLACFRDKSGVRKPALYMHLYFVVPVRVFLPPGACGLQLSLVFIAAIVLRTGLFQTGDESRVPIDHRTPVLRRESPWSPSSSSSAIPYDGTPSNCSYIHVPVTIAYLAVVICYTAFVCLVLQFLFLLWILLRRFLLQ